LSARAEEDNNVGVGSAGSGSVVLGGGVVCISAQCDTSGADDLVASRLGGNDTDTPGHERVAVDVGEVVPQGGGLESVLELGDVGSSDVGSELHGDSTTVGVVAVGFSVLTTVGGKSLHGTSDIADGPEVGVEVALVLDDDITSRGHGGRGGKQHSCARDHVGNHVFGICFFGLSG